MGWAARLAESLARAGLVTDSLELQHKIDMALDVASRANGAVMLTHDGNVINPLDPDPITVEEIAHVLSQFCRYGGHCPEPYSVGQHSLLVSYLVPQTGDLPRMGLLHDAHEAYFGDWPKPVKNCVEGLRTIEARIEKKVRTALGLPLVLPPEVKRADLDALAIEMRWLWASRMPADPVLAGRFSWLLSLPPRDVREAFLTRYAAVRNTAAGSDDR